MRVKINGSWDGTPADPVTLTGQFTLDTQDAADTQTAAAVAATLSERIGAATVAVTTPDPATVQVTLTL